MTENMSFLDFAPIEIISRIFQLCEAFGDVASFASTSKHARSVSISEASVIIMEVGRSSIVAFDHALIAVRATSMVVQAHKQGQQPPLIHPSALSLKNRRPALEELEGLMDMNHLVLCIGHIFKLVFEKRAPSIEFVISKSWIINFHTTIYRILAAGAFMSNCLHAPFFAQNKPKNFLHTYSQALQESRNPGVEGVHGNWSLLRTEIEFLRTFPAFDSQTHEVCDGVSAPFVDWFFEDVRRAFELKQKNLQGMDGSTFEHSILRELARIAWTATALCSGADVLQYLRNADNVFGSMRAAWDPAQTSAVTAGRRTRSVDVVLFGVFQLESMQMPAVVEDVEYNLLLATRVPQPSTSPITTDIPTLQRIFPHIEPDGSDQAEESAAPMQLMSCLLHRGLGQRLQYDYIEIDDTNQLKSIYKDMRNLFGDADPGEMCMMLGI